MLRSRASRRHGAGGGASVVTTWSTTDKGSLLTLSNGNLTATHGATTGSAMVRATVGRSSGKYVFAVNPDNGATVGDIDFGLAQGDASLSSMMTNSPGKFGLQSNGLVYSGNAQRAAAGVGPSWTAANSEIMFEVDLDAKQVRISVDGGAWFGPYDISNLVFPVYPAVAAWAANYAATANFGGNAFTRSVTAGFTGWNG